jgi:hypothetical protein
MRDIEEYLEYRDFLLQDSADENGFVSDSDILSLVFPSLLEAKLVDSSESNEAYYFDEEKNHKINSYSISESGERLQLFVIDEESTIERTDKNDLLVSARVVYEKHFLRVKKFIRSVLAGVTVDIQHSDSIRPLISKLISVEGFKQFDVIDIFVVSLTATVSRSGGSVNTTKMFFKDDTIKATLQDHTGEPIAKEFLVMHHLIDLNFLYEVQVSKGSGAPLVINFEKNYGLGIPVLQAASEQKFESYLCVLSAETLADLYKRYSTRLLEKNIRSFLQFRGVNAGIRKTLREEPEKFIAYNNGLTITAIDVTISHKKGILRIDSLTDFQIVNGGQTTASIYFSKKDGIDVSKVNVMAKINIAKMTKMKDLDELISNISQFSNAQSRVSKVDLRARNPQLLKLKQLSESVPTPTGEGWFFERAKGEYNTKIRLNRHQKNKINKQFPPERRFSKELLAKYYSAWGGTPHLVKKGGEKIFRFFIEDISGEARGGKVVDIDRDFYEAVISKIIIFRCMENIYGKGKTAMGQIRATVIPYSISILYINSDADPNRRNFDLTKIWNRQALESDLEAYLESLMLMMNELIKKYSDSDDYNEFSKKEQLWIRIRSCNEIKEFLSASISLKIFDKYASKN